MATISLKRIFLIFLKMGSLAFGGVYSMLAFFERELVERQKWLTHEEFAESVVIGQMTPGPPIVNTGICIGYKLKKIKGALAATAGQSFTGAFMAVLLAVFYVKSKGNAILASALKGVGAAVVGLLVSVVLKMAKGAIRDYKAGVFALAAFLALALFKLNPIGLIMASGILGLIVYGKRA
ncbi:MAG: chromate transporter [Desulfobacteraceae bacterium]|nr:chromate transporter [Desulfobacteraceae bacterium]